MPNPLQSDKIDGALTDFSVGYFMDRMQENFLFASAFPYKPVENSSDKYYVWDKDDLRRIDARGRADGDEAAIKRVRLSNDSYNCDETALRYPVTRNVQADLSEVDPLEAATQALMDDIWRRSEQKFVTSFFATGTWGTDLSGTTGAVTAGTNFKKFNESGSTPIKDIRLAMKILLQNSGRLATDVAMGYEVFNHLLDNADITGRLGENAPQIVTRQFLANLLGVRRIHVSNVSYNSAAEGLTASNSFVAADDILVYHRPESLGLNNPSAGAVFAWTGRPGASSIGTVVRRYEENPRDAETVEVQAFHDFKVTSAACGVFMNDCL